MAAMHAEQGLQREGAAREVHGLEPVLQARGRGARQGHEGHIQGPPVLQGRAVRLLEARGLVEDSRGAHRQRGGDIPEAQDTLPRRQHLHGRHRRRRGEEVRPRGVPARAGRLQGDGLVLELHGLAGPEARHEVRREGREELRAHAQLHRRSPRTGRWSR